MQRQRGNQPLTQIDKEKMVRRLEPYLKAGLSIRIACQESGVPRSTLYDAIATDDLFADQIKRFQSYISVLVSNLLTRQLLEIHQRQKQNAKLGWEDLQFLMWYALNSKHCKEEFGRVAREQPTIDPIAEIQKITRLIDASCEG